MQSRQPVNPPLTFALKLDATHPYLVERGVSAEVIVQFGLGYCSRGVIAGRICIPIHDAAGQLVAYAGRWPDKDVPEDQERYKLPKNFQKSRVLFNLHRVAEGKHIVLVEGYLVDVPAPCAWRTRCRPDGLLGLRGAARALARARHA